MSASTAEKDHGKEDAQVWEGRAQLTCRLGRSTTLGRARLSRVRGHSLSLVLPAAQLTPAPELWEAEVFIIDNKNCDSIFHKKTLYPQVVPLIRKNMICTTNYGEDLCYVSFWEHSGNSLFGE